MARVPFWRPEYEDEMSQHERVTLNCYDQLAELSEEMLGAARQSNWDGLSALEVKAQLVVNDLKAMPETSGHSTVFRQEKMRLIRLILALRRHRFVTWCSPDWRSSTAPCARPAPRGGCRLPTAAVGSIDVMRQTGRPPSPSWNLLARYSWSALCARRNLAL